MKWICLLLFNKSNNVFYIFKDSTSVLAAFVLCVSIMKDDLSKFPM